jgi:hypothetical protein
VYKKHILSLYLSLSCTLTFTIVTGAPQVAGTSGMSYLSTKTKVLLLHVYAADGRRVPRATSHSATSVRRVRRFLFSVHNMWKRYL